MQWPGFLRGKSSYLLGLLIECKVPVSSYAARSKSSSVSPLLRLLGFSGWPKPVLQSPASSRKCDTAHAVPRFGAGCSWIPCRNTAQDNAMLVHWEIDNGGALFLRPLPTPVPTPQRFTATASLQLLFRVRAACNWLGYPSGPRPGCENNQPVGPPFYLTLAETIAAVWDDPTRVATQP